MIINRMVLFDIDGTLLRSDGAGKAAMRTALVQVYGTAGPIDVFSFAGRTDREAVAYLLRAAGLAEETIWEKFDSLETALADSLRLRLANGHHHITAYPGTLDVVKALVDKDHVLVGLLTGNMAATAALKLTAAGFDPAQFTIGAYGSHSENREDLATLAVQQAQEEHGLNFVGKQVVIVGDTPADILCGAAIGALTVGVLTGWNSYRDLYDVGAHIILDDLSNVENVVETLSGSMK